MPLLYANFAGPQSALRARLRLTHHNTTHASQALGCKLIACSELYGTAVHLYGKSVDRTSPTCNRLFLRLLADPAALSHLPKLSSDREVLHPAYRHTFAITHPVLLACCTVHHTLRSSQHRGSFAGHAGAASLCGRSGSCIAPDSSGAAQHSCCSAVLKTAQHQFVALLGALTPVQASGAGNTAPTTHVIASAVLVDYLVLAL